MLILEKISWSMARCEIGLLFLQSWSFLSFQVLMMDSGIDPDASLDYATIQIFPTKNKLVVFA